ncbi:exported hypothetical protein [Verrucomicrobia bacterium]|nr:exported hypothetical protein [Verrucomicrobiota bacterium]
MRFFIWSLSLAVATTCLAADPIPLWPHSAPGEKGDLGPELDTTKPSDNSSSHFGARSARFLAVW